MLWRIFFLWYSIHGLVKGAAMPKTTKQKTGTNSPAVGDEVLYRAEERWVLAEILEVRTDDELLLLCDMGNDLVTQRATHGPHADGWLTYHEAAQSVG